jgi:UDP-glucose 4-epimerase
MNGYISARDAAQKWDVSERQIQRMCKDGMIDGVIHFGKSWAIPENAEKPTRTGELKPGRNKKD